MITGVLNSRGIVNPNLAPDGNGIVNLRPPISSVGNKSTVPYGPTNGYATPNGVTGFIGPAAGSLQQPTSWYIRAEGSNTNGGSSPGLSPDRTGTDGVINSTTTFTSATAAFTPADKGKGIYISGAVGQHQFKIKSVTNATTIILSQSSGASSSGNTWAIGGALQATNNLNFCGVIFETGDSVYIGSGTFRFVMSIQGNPAFNGQMNIVGDVTGQFTGDAGMVQLTAYTTNDKTAPSATTLLNLNGKSNLSFSNIMFQGGDATLITASTATSQNISFRDCSFTGIVGTSNRVILTATCSFGTSFGWVFDRCIINAMRTDIFVLTAPGSSGGSDYSLNFTVNNCEAYGFGDQAQNFFAVAGSASTFKPGGAFIRNCSIIGFRGLNTSTGTSTSLPCQIYNCLIATGAGTALNAQASNQILEDYNLIYAATPRTLVTAGTHSVSDGSYAPLFHFGQERIWGALLRPFGEPMASSPLLGFGNDGGQTPYDILSRPRPSGGLSALPAVGAFERGGTAAQAQTPAPPSGTNVWQFTGPGIQPFEIPVQIGVPTTIAVSVQRDSGYSGSANPELVILANPTIGVAAQTVIDSGASGGWNTLTSASFTPTANGVVTVWVVSNDRTGSSVVSFADFVIS